MHTIELTSPCKPNVNPLSVTPPSVLVWLPVMCPPDGELDFVDEEGVVEGGVVEDLDGVVEGGVVAEGVVEDLPWKRQLQYASYPLAVGGCLTICDPPPS